MSSKAPFSRKFRDWPGAVALAAVAFLWLAAALGGGSARYDVPHVVVVRLVAVAALVATVWMVPAERLRERRVGWAFAAVAMLAVALQLVPLPPSVWSVLPARDLYAGLTSDGLAQVWRPISLSPDLTLNSLLALLPPLAMLVAAGVLNRDGRRLILLGLLATALLSGLLGLLQLADGPDSPLRHYRFNSSDSGTGFFANRNHQAVFLAMGIPVLAWWFTREGSRFKAKWLRLALAVSGVLFLMISTVATQSRTGALVVALSLVLSFALIVKEKGRAFKPLLWVGGSAVLLMGAAAALSAGWLQSRLSMSVIQNDTRLRVLPETMEMLRAYFPVGSGFGSFHTAYQRFESLEDLSPYNLNHSHSELTQIVIEGGIISILLVLILIAWFLLRTWQSWAVRSSEGGAEARVASIIVLLPLVASITDYPLRTPLMACAFAAAAALLGTSHHWRDSRAKGKP